MSELSMQVSRTIKAPAEALFNAWLEPKMLAKFMIPGEGMPEPRVENDPREGGAFLIVMQGQDRELPHKGVYKTINRHSRIVFTWESEFSPEGSTVTLDFAEVAEGTRVDLTHVKFLSEEMRDNHQAGWGQILATLEAVSASVAA